MTDKRVCEICGTIYDAALDRCPLCETPYQAFSSEAEEYDEYDYEEEIPVKSRARQSDSEPGWKVVIAVILSVAMVLFAAFIAYEFLIGSPAADGSVACTGLYLAENEVELTRVGEAYYLSVRVTPNEVTDAISYTSADETVAQVDQYGKIVAVSDGQTQVTVTCGDYSAACNVTCSWEE